MDYLRWWWICLAILLAALLQGCSDCGVYDSEDFVYGNFGEYECPSGTLQIVEVERCECAAARLSAGWDGQISKANRPRFCYRYGTTGANLNTHSSGGTDAQARPICRQVSAPAPPPSPPPAPSPELSSCCKTLLGLGRTRRLDGPAPACTQEECDKELATAR
eukprot:TRINITY_DN28996_c0_g1_i1.p1 TRINITY_DN28996_c0_g1~~TRINITY_DN28996_c0_g1_i1.p1  ORF type:complete len:163 (+),score=14.65 TRINITY_DN28996_c0_g1_i1:3-491(+)